MLNDSFEVLAISTGLTESELIKRLRYRIIENGFQNKLKNNQEITIENLADLYRVKIKMIVTRFFTKDEINVETIELIKNVTIKITK